MIEELGLYILYGIIIVFLIVFVVAGIIWLWEISMSNPEIGLIVIGTIIGILLYINKYYCMCFGY